MGTNNQFSIKTGDLLYFINDGHKLSSKKVNLLTPFMFRRLWPLTEEIL